MATILHIHPAVNLLIGATIIGIFFWTLWPKKGMLSLINRFSKHNKRILLEDALKFIFDCEYIKTNCNIDSIAGHLNISTDRSGKLVNQLTQSELITVSNQIVALTDAGRSYALRIVRIHRIWERYLADHTSVAPADWHNEACRIEHLVTSEETEKLAAQMGNPVFDPHGDPIPTPSGALPKAKGVLLNTLQKGEMGKIIHLEDEPQSIYEQLLVQGLYPGMQLYVTEVTDKKITFIAEGNEHALTPIFAGYITIEKINIKLAAQPAHKLLSSLHIGENAEIVGISQNCRGQQRRRLMDLGFVPGSQVSAIMKSASGDPVGYRILGTTIGIRKNHADMIFIKAQTK